MKTEMPKTVRFAAASDEDEIMRLMHAAFKEQPIFPLNEKKMRETIRACTLDDLVKRKGMVAVVGEPGALEGYLIAIFIPYWYTNEYHLEELSNFVHPDHRFAWKGHARSLIEFTKWFAEFCGVPLVMGIFSTKRLDGKIRLYERQVKKCGAVFVHNTGHMDGLLSEMG